MEVMSGQQINVRHISPPNSTPTILCRLDTNAAYNTTYESKSIECDEIPSIINVVSVDVTSAANVSALYEIRRALQTMSTMISVDFFDAIKDRRHVLFAHPAKV